MSDAVVTAPAPASAPVERPTQFATVADGVAELQRRQEEARATRRADKAERDDRVAEQRKAAAKVEAEMEAEHEAGGAEDDAPEVKPKVKAKAAPKAEAEEADGENEDDARQSADGEDEDSDDDRQVATDEEDDDEDSDSAIDIDGKRLSIPKGTPKAVREALSKMAGDLKADYTRKTQEVAQGRQAMAQRTQQMDSQSRQVMQAQEAVMQMAQQMIGQPPPLEMAQHDIQQYTIQKALYEQRLAQLQGLGGHARNLKQAQQQQQQQEQQQRLQDEAQHMVRVLPKLASPEARQAFMGKAVRAAQASGFSPEDVAQVGDHRMLHLLDRLITAESQLAAANRAGGSVRTRLANVPPKVARGGNASADQGKGQKAQKAQQEFMASKRSLADVRRFLQSRET